MVNKYQKHKERLWKEAHERYQNFFWIRKRQKVKKNRKRYQSFAEEEKEKKHQYYEECKQKLSEYRRNYLTHKK